MKPIAVVLVALAWPIPVAAQSAADHFAAGVHAYDELQFADAADHLRRSVSSSDSSLVGVVRSQALAYLGAAEWFQGRPDSAAATFRRLVLHDPAFHLDTLRFPPAVTGVFEALRRQTYTVRAETPATADIKLGQARVIASLQASTPHRVKASVSAGAASRTIFEETVTDTAAVSWDGRIGSGPAADGTYDLAIVSFDPRNRPIREVHFSVTVWTQHGDTLAYPDAPADGTTVTVPSGGSSSRMSALAWGLVTAGAALLLPRAVTGDQPTAYGGVAAGVIGAVALGGVLRTAPGSGGRPVATPPVLRPDQRRWSDSVAAVRTENARRLARDITLHLRIESRPGAERE